VFIRDHMEYWQLGMQEASWNLLPKWELAGRNQIKRH